MKHNLLLAIIFLSIISCQHGEQSKQNESPSEKIRRETVLLTEDYATKQLKDSKRSLDSNGYITIEDSLKRYVFDPARIITGFIDEDSTEDAIVTLTSFIGDEIALIEHLILLNTNGKLMLIKSVEADMKILRLADKVITVEVHTRPRTSPLYNCAACKAIINYKFKDGDLVKIADATTSSQD